MHGGGPDAGERDVGELEDGIRWSAARPGHIHHFVIIIIIIIVVWRIVAQVLILEAFDQPYDHLHRRIRVSGARFVKGERLDAARNLAQQESLLIYDARELLSVKERMDDFGEDDVTDRIDTAQKTPNGKDINMMKLERVQYDTREEIEGERAERDNRCVPFGT